MELAIFFSKGIALLEYKTKTKANKTKYKDEEMLTKNSNHHSEYWGCKETFHLMIPKVVYPYEYMDDRKNFDKTKLPPKNALYSKLSMKGIVIKIGSKSGIP